MASNFIASSSQTITCSTTPIADIPVTISCWFNANDTSHDQDLIRIGLTDFSNILALQAQNGGNVRWVYRGSNAPSFPIVTSSNTYSSSQWSNAIGQTDGLASHQVWLNGIKTFATTVGLPINPALTKFNIGSDPVAGGPNWMNGKIAEIAMWNVGLTDLEKTSLSKGANPLRIRPSAIVFYSPLIQNLIELRTARVMTNSNGVTFVSDYPPVYKQ